MAIVTKKFEDVATLKLLDDLREILLNDHELNLSFIKSKGWAYAQRDDHQLLEEDSVYLEQAFINLSQNKIYAVWVDDVLSKKISEINIQEIDIDHYSLEYLQNPYNDFTMDNSIIFSAPDLEFIILRPCTFETELYVASNLSFVEDVAKGEGWVVMQ